uniref:Uncharacterized protein n=1 Tax=Parascaris equorum TaxID=6256 RepID=A0A914RDN1_PAREQ
MKHSSGSSDVGFQMQAVMLGQSFAGILTSLLSIFCQAFTSNSLLNGRLYFAIAMIWTLASGVLYIWLIKSPHTIAVMNTEVNESSRTKVALFYVGELHKISRLMRFFAAYFSAVACFLLFNVGDAIGRLLFHVVPLVSLRYFLFLC